MYFSAFIVQTFNSDVIINVNKLNTKVISDLITKKTGDILSADYCNISIINSILNIYYIIVDGNSDTYCFFITIL